ncbi:MAG TPA: hypothetical protein ENI45_02640 [Thermoplasmatales archaeon]|nr:hypothetical protein [Thermoplasmatales archaeon]
MKKIAVLSIACMLVFTATVAMAASARHNINNTNHKQVNNSSSTVKDQTSQSTAGQTSNPLQIILTGGDSLTISIRNTGDNPVFFGGWFYAIQLVSIQGLDTLISDFGEILPVNPIRPGETRTVFTRAADEFGGFKGGGVYVAVYCTYNFQLFNTTEFRLIVIINLPFSGPQVILKELGDSLNPCNPQKPQPAEHDHTPTIKPQLTTHATSTSKRQE